VAESSLFSRPIRWLGSRDAAPVDLRAALAYWVRRAERLEDELPGSTRYLAARGVTGKNYALGKAVADAEEAKPW
jgi:hypothetical protein